MKAASSSHREIDHYWDDPTFREMIDFDLKTVKKHKAWMNRESEK